MQKAQINFLRIIIFRRLNGISEGENFNAIRLKYRKEKLDGNVNRSKIENEKINY